MKKILEILLAIAGKLTITASIQTDSDTVAKTPKMVERFGRITSKLHAAAEHILDIVKPEGSFAKDCDKIMGDSDTTPIKFMIPLPDGTSYGIEMLIPTIGYTPAQRDLAELVTEAMDPVLEEIEQAWYDDGTPVDEITAWRIAAEASIHEQLGLPIGHGELVGASIGGSGSEGDGIQHGRDAAIG